MDIISSNQKQCQLCLENASKYTCPRCNILYCSLSCFKSSKHSSCSESFYKESCMSMLQSGKDISKEDEIKFQQLLQNMDDDFSSSDDELENRLKGINLENDSEVWEQLNEMEKEEFKKLIAGSIDTSIVEPWIPWWHNNHFISETDTKINKIQSNEVKSKNTELTNPPSIKKPVHIAVKYNITNILFCYVFLMRFYNGDIKEFLTEFCEHLLTCSYLGEKVSTCFECTQASTEKAASRLNNICKNSMTLAYSDLAEVINKDFVLFALQETAISLRKCFDHSNVKNIKKKLFNAIKKIEFLETWYKLNETVNIELLVDVHALLVEK